MHHFHFVTLSLVLAFYGLQSSVTASSLDLISRSTDVTCAGLFPKAGDGYAKRPDGCSSWSDNPDQVRDKWGSANFGGVCDDHDRCYYTKGSNVDQCNGAFCSGLRNACHNAYCKKAIGVDWCTPGLYLGCLAIAETYCTFVRVVRAKVYHAAQDDQESYLKCIATSGGLQPGPSCGANRPEGATWTEHPYGLRCTTRYYVCRSGKSVVTREYRDIWCIEDH